MAGFFLYYKRFTCHWLKEMRSFGAEQVAGVVLAVLILSFQIRGGLVPAKDAEPTVLATFLLPYLGLAAVYLVVHLVRTPWKMDREREIAVTTVNTEKALLQEALDKELTNPAKLEVTLLELQRELTREGVGRHIFIRAKIELIDPLQVSVSNYRLELSRGGVIADPEYRDDILNWESNNWRTGLCHQELRPLPMQLYCGDPKEGWVHFFTSWENKELDASRIRVVVHTPRGAGYGQSSAGPEYWNPVEGKIIAEKD